MIYVCFWIRFTGGNIGKKQQQKTKKQKKQKNKKQKTQDKTEPTQSSDKKNGHMLLPGGRLFESQ